MRDKVNSVLDIIGLGRNSVQVTDYNNSDPQLLYPNFFTLTSIDRKVKDKELLGEMIRLMEEHKAEVEYEISLAKSALKNYFGKDYDERFNT